jgi:hypothetical protein
VDFNGTRLDYAAAFSRISARYQQRFELTLPYLGPDTAEGTRPRSISSSDT